MCILPGHSPFFGEKNIGSRHWSDRLHLRWRLQAPSLWDLGPLAPVTPGLLAAYTGNDTHLEHALAVQIPRGKVRLLLQVVGLMFGSVLVNYPSFIFSFTESAGSKC